VYQPRAIERVATVIADASRQAESLHGSPAPAVDLATTIGRREPKDPLVLLVIGLMFPFHLLFIECGLQGVFGVRQDVVLDAAAAAGWMTVAPGKTARMLATAVPATPECRVSPSDWPRYVPA